MGYGCCNICVMRGHIIHECNVLSSSSFRMKESKAKKKLVIKKQTYNLKQQKKRCYRISQKTKKHKIKYCNLQSAHEFLRDHYYNEFDSEIFGIFC